MTFSVDRSLITRYRRVSTWHCQSARMVDLCFFHLQSCRQSNKHDHLRVWV